MDYKITKITDYNNSEFQSVFTSYYNEIGIEIKMNTDLWNIMSNTKEMYCYAAENKGQIIGFIMFQNECLNSSTGFFIERVGYIRELYVRKEFRKSGFGSVLLDIAKKHFKQNSVFKLILTYEKEAIDFYKKLGFIEDKSFTAKNNRGVVIKII